MPGLAVIGFAAASGFIHHFVTGANRVSGEDEESGKAAGRGADAMRCGHE